MKRQLPVFQRLFGSFVNAICESEKLLIFDSVTSFPSLASCLFPCDNRRSFLAHVGLMSLWFLWSHPYWHNSRYYIQTVRKSAIATFYEILVRSIPWLHPFSTLMVPCTPTEKMAVLKTPCIYVLTQSLRTSNDPFSQFSQSLHFYVFRERIRETFSTEGGQKKEWLHRFSDWQDCETGQNEEMRTVPPNTRHSRGAKDPVLRILSWERACEIERVRQLLLADWLSRVCTVNTCWYIGQVTVDYYLFFGVTTK